MKRMNSGFTLVELVIVILLISIISAVGIGLFPSTDNYAARLVSDQWLTSLRLSQRIALLRQDATNLVTLTIAQTASDWTLTVTQSTTTVETFTIEREGVEAKLSTSDFSTACNALASTTFPQLLYFNGYGDLVNAARVQITTNTRLCFDGPTSREMCIAPSGYAYEGNCI